MVLLVVRALIDLSTADQAASVIGGVLALGGLIAALWRRPGQEEFTTREQLDLAAAHLAQSVGQQWGEESDRRGLRVQPLASVGWTLAELDYRSSQQAPEAVAVAGEGGRAPADSTDATVLERSGFEPLTASIVDAWRHASGSWLFVVGDPGSGKSTVAILLLLELLRQQDVEDTPVPVLFSAVSWDPKISFEKWAAKRLSQTYRFLDNQKRYGGRAAEALVRSTRLLIILDGLDELSPGRRQEAIDALARSQPHDRSLVVTSRENPPPPSVDLAVLTPPPPGMVLRLQNMEPGVTMRYLSAAQESPEPARPGLLRRLLRLPSGVPEPARVPNNDRWERIRSALRAFGSPIQQVLTVPLYASLARRMYADEASSPHELLNLDTVADVRRHLVAGFLAAALRVRLRRLDGDTSNDGRPWGTVRTQRSLRRLAEFTRDHPMGGLEWWRLEEMIGRSVNIVVSAVLAGLLYGLTSDLPTGLRRGTALGFTAAVLVALHRGRLSGRRNGLRAGAAVAAGVAIVGWWQIGLAAGLLDGAELGVGIAVVVWYAQLLRAGVVAAFGVGCRAGLILGLLMGIVDTLRDGPTTGAVRLVTTGVGVVISLGMPLSLINRFQVAEPSNQPGRLNVSWARTRPLIVQLGVGTLCGLGVGAGGALIGGIRYAVAHGADQGLTFAIRVGLTYGVSVGLGIGLVGGLVHWLTQPSEQRTAADPKSTLRAARTVALSYLIVPTLTCAAILYGLDAAGLTPPSATSSGASAGTGAGLGFCLGLVFATGFTPWPTYLLVKISSLCAGCRFDLVHLAEQAQRCELMRRDGAAYQWRHVAVQDMLCVWTPHPILEPIAASAASDTGAGRIQSAG